MLVSFSEKKILVAMRRSSLAFFLACYFSIQNQVPQGTAWNSVLHPPYILKLYRPEESLSLPSSACVNYQFFSKQL